MRARSIFFLLGAMCCAQAVAAEALAPVERPARIRLFGQNGIGLTLYTNARCEDEYDEEIDGSGSVSHAFRTLVGKKRPNQTLGIAETEATRNLASRDRLLANPYYQEFALVPGQRVLLDAQISNGSGWRCVRNVRGAFTAERGVDYEGEMVLQGGVCLLNVRRVASDGQTTPVALSPPPPACSADVAAAPPSLMTMLFASGHVQYRIAEAGADMDELDDDEDSLEDFQEAIDEAPLPSGMKLCVVATEEAKAGPLASRLPALLAARGAEVQLIRASADALQAEWGLTEERPLTFALAEYYCRSAAGY